MRERPGEETYNPWLPKGKNVARKLWGNKASQNSSARAASVVPAYLHRFPYQQDILRLEVTVSDVQRVAEHHS